MKRSNSKKTMCFLAAIALILGAFSSSAIITAQAAAPSYYICYESGGYRVIASNALKKSGDDEYTVSPYLTRGDKILISDGAGRMWGNSKGGPVTVTDSGRRRYTVTFNPETPYTNGSNVQISAYSPAVYEVAVNGTGAGQMTYRSANALFEEYYYSVDLSGGETITVTGKDGVYGADGLGGEGITIPLGGSYRISFTTDADNLYGDGDYIDFSEIPELYLLCGENNQTVSPKYRLTRDEDVIAYEQYRALLNVPAKDCEISYSVYDAGGDAYYKPSSSGKITVKDKGNYYAVYSPSHVYSASGDEVFYTALQRKSEYYDGYYVLGDFNGFTYIDGDENFKSQYGLVKDDGQTAYDEYTLTLNVSEETLRLFDGRVEFYISDGESLYRKPNGANIGIEQAGEYKLTFSPVHDYGRGYRYRYERTGQQAQTETVTLSSAEQFKQFLQSCTSPEFSLNKKFLLACDVDLKGDFTPALIFAGELDCMYRRVSGIKNSSENDNFLFREVTEDGVVRRAVFDAALSSRQESTALIGRNGGLISEVIVTGFVDGDDYTAAIAATNLSGGKIEKCKNYASVNGVLNTGGIVGFNAGKAVDCSNYGAVNSKSFPASDASAMLNVGGVAGYSTGVLLSCKNEGAVGSRQGRYVGGIVGLSSGGIFSCINSGRVSGADYTGGIVGYYGRFSNSGSDLNDYLEGGKFEYWLNKYFGSDSGSFEESEDSGIHEVYYCLNFGAVTSESYSGGIAGHAGASSLKILGCVSTGAVESRASYAGGIVGELSEGKTDGCLTYGDVTASASYAGGIVGSSAASVQNCLSSAYVKALNYCGGIAGYASSVKGCVTNTFVETDSEGKFFGSIAGNGIISNYEYNYYVEGGVKGVSGVDYGFDSSYAAHGLPQDKVMSEGMLSADLIGLNADEWIAGESECRYPVPRALTEMREPEIYTDKSAFEQAYEKISNTLNDCAETGSRVSVTVTFYGYDFDSESYDRLASFRLPAGEGIAQTDVPKVPEKEGYFVWWDRADFSSFNENTAVYQLYDKQLTTIAAGGGDKPTVLVEGVFYSDTVLNLEYNGEYISLKFTRGGKEVFYGDVTVKYYVGGTDGYTVKLVRGGEIKDADFKVYGEYLGFNLSEGWAFAAVKQQSSLQPLWIALSAGGGALLVCIIFMAVLLIKRRGNNKKTAVVSAADAQNKTDVGKIKASDLNDIEKSNADTIQNEKNK